MSRTKHAFVTGITGQDGSYLAELLIEKGYHVHGLVRRSSSSNCMRIQHLIDDPTLQGRFYLHEGDLSDASNLNRLIEEILPDEIYNLGAQSHVKVSFNTPVYTADIDAIGPLRLLEAMRISCPHARFYQASTSELYGKVTQTPQDESTSFYPRSPYGVAKLYAYWAVVNYREAYDLFACNGILFNHESPRRGDTFVSKKITKGVARIQMGQQDKIILGNLDAQRDWGYARDFVYGMWLMLQQEKPDDFVLATGQTTTVRRFVELAFQEIGISLIWEGKGVNEKGIDPNTGEVRVEVSEQFFRPSEVDLLIGNPTKAKEKLGWSSQVDIHGLVKIMVQADINSLSEDKNCSHSLS